MFTITRNLVLVAALATAMVPCVATAEVRPLSTDRPDRTESAFTVPRGWFQIESDLVSRGRIDGDSERVTATSVMTINAKYGVTQNIDVQLLVSPWVRIEESLAGGNALFTTTDSGPAGLRLKFNLAGNDGGGPAFALLPFAFVPTQGDSVFDHVTWGIVTPLSIPIGDNAAFSAMVGYSRIDNDDSWVTASMSLGSAIAGDFAGFVELYISRNSFDNDAIDDATIDAGITYAPGENWQLDTGIYRGLASETEDWRVFLGASARFPLLR
jgi:hypothetical protein